VRPAGVAYRRCIRVCLGCNAWLACTWRTWVDWEWCLGQRWMEYVNVLLTADRRQIATTVWNALRFFYNAEFIVCEVCMLWIAGPVADPYLGFGVGSLCHILFFFPYCPSLPVLPYFRTLFPLTPARGFWSAVSSLVSGVRVKRWMKLICVCIVWIETVTVKFLPR